VSVGVLAASAAVLVGSSVVDGSRATAVSANRWPWPVRYQQVAVFPTWLVVPTKLCVTNVETTPGMGATVWVEPGQRPKPLVHAVGFDVVHAQPGRTACIRRSWAGSPIFAKNVSPTRATVRLAAY
jgi:hypothetical protein